MEAEAALRAVRGLAKANRLVFTKHAAREAVECGASRNDVCCALGNAQTIRESGRGRASDWTVTGPDKDGDDLEVAVVLEDGILVITVY